MATKTINTRIKNRVDSLANWQGEGVSLLPGEIALVRVNTQTVDEHGNIVDVPALLMKVGESDGNGGTKAFDDLPWLSAIAADVYDWAKSASATEVPVTVGSTTSTLGAYLTQVNTNTSDISANTQAIAKLNGNSSTAGSVAKAIADAINALDGGTDSGTSGAGKYVSKVVQTNGKVATTYTAFPAASTGTAGIIKLGASGGAAKHDDVFGTGTGTIATRLSTAESDIGDLKNAVKGGTHFKGTASAAPTVRSVAMSDGTTITAAAGDIVLHGQKEYICSAIDTSKAATAAGSATWVELGDLSRVGAVEEAIEAMDVTATNAVATTHKFVSQVTQSNGKVTVAYHQPQATDVYYDSDSSVKGKLDEIDAAIANKAASDHTHSGYVNQNAFSNIKVSKSGGGSSDVTVAAETATDTVTFVGSNVTITGDATNDKVTFAVADGSTSVKGLVKMSDAINSDVSTTAATSKAVKLAYDKAASAEAGLASKAASDHTHAAYVNQNAFSTIAAGDGTVAADKATDTVTFTGTNVTITPNASTDTINFAVADGSTTAKGVVQMSDAINSDVSTTAATSKAVKTAYDLANEANAAAGALASSKADANHTHSVYANQNAFSNVKVGSTTIAADTTTDTFEIVAGTNVSLTGDATNDKVTINVPNASTTAKGAVQLTDSTSSTSTSTAATPNSVKAAYDKANDALAEAAKKSPSDHTHPGYVNQNAFSNIAVSGQTTVAADSATDTVTFVGSNVSITTDATNDKVTFSVANGSTSTKGVVKLTDAVNSSSTSLAATANAVKKAYDLANTADAAAAAIEADYVRFNAADNHMYVGTEGTDYIIFDCGGAAGWETAAATTYNMRMTTPAVSSGSDGVFEPDGNASDLTGVEINGQTVDPSNYTVE